MVVFISLLDHMPDRCFRCREAVEKRGHTRPRPHVRRVEGELPRNTSKRPHAHSHVSSDQSGAAAAVAMLGQETPR